MKRVCICGWCYSSIKDAYPVKIISGMKDRERCAFCGRLCYGYICEAGKEETREEDNERRPGNYKSALS